MVTAVDQLQYTVASRQYALAASMLGAVNQLSDYFHSYEAVPKIAELNERATALREALSKWPAPLPLTSCRHLLGSLHGAGQQIYDDFSHIGELTGAAQLVRGCRSAEPLSLPASAPDASTRTCIRAGRGDGTDAP